MTPQSDMNEAFKNALQSSAVQRPIFAPSSQVGQSSGDVDLSEVFADYFIHEFDDPINTGSYTNAVSAMAAVQAATSSHQVAGTSQTSVAGDVSCVVAGGGSKVSLPTSRGIRTAWHVGSMPSLSATAAHQLGVNQFQNALAGGSNQQSTPQINEQHDHLQKKQKLSTHQSRLTTAPQSAQQGHHPAAALASAPAIGQPSVLPGHAGPMTERGSAISNRLGIPMVGGQVSLPCRGDLSLQGEGPTNGSSESIAQQTTSSTGVSLPVGVGIRLGGITDQIQQAQAQQQNLQRQGLSGIPVTHTQWNAQEGQRGLQGLFHQNMGKDGELSEQVIAERRQRNREHAKRSRVRKKFLLESLQEQVRALQKENTELRMCIQERIPDKAQSIISECCKGSPLFQDDKDDCASSETGGKDKAAELEQADFTLIRSLTSGQQNFVLSDPRLPDNPIVFASEGFFELTGYTREEILGRNCRFLQGPGTDLRHVDIIRKAVANGTECTTCILNYKADGTPFWNQFFVAPLKDADNCIVNYVGVQCAVEQDVGPTVLEAKVNAILPLQHKEKSDDGLSEDKS